MEVAPIVFSFVLFVFVCSEHLLHVGVGQGLLLVLEVVHVVVLLDCLEHAHNVGRIIALILEALHIAAKVIDNDFPLLLVRV